MLIEVGFVQKFSLIIGNPGYSIAVILGSLIFATGIGSLSSDVLFKSEVLNVKRTVIILCFYTVFLIIGYENFVKELNKITNHFKN